jgi:hypothetical protein
VTPRKVAAAACGPSERKGRLEQAEGFWQSAEDLSELDHLQRNSIVSLYVLAGIAASDVICCARLGERSTSDNHTDAAALLGRAAPDMVASLQRLLSGKSAAAYGASPSSGQRVTEARNAARRLVDAAREL